MGKAKIGEASKPAESLVRPSRHTISASPVNLSMRTSCDAADANRNQNIHFFFNVLMFFVISNYVFLAKVCCLRLKWIGFCWPLLLAMWRTISLAAPARGPWAATSPTPSLEYWSKFRAFRETERGITIESVAKNLLGSVSLWGLCRLYVSACYA
ncbi:histone-arginine methyltransferase CARMER [Striga asiatica]|uniref:Histone-arginine methyltransferase CARMER n=1 Tax=Striga asiatica TaxID=4170 RepID=A0A5A7PG30_STRAF|nr:histone-arginine methyltransferase CARMER [Striga asiatica]